MSDAFVQALMQEQKRYQQNNLWDQGGDVMSRMSGALMQDQSGNATDNLTAALLSGLAGGFSKAYAQKANRDFAGELAQSLRGTAKDFYSTGDASALYNSPFQSVRELAPVMEFQQAEDNFKLDQLMKRDQSLNDMRMQGALLDNGIVMSKDDQGALKFTTNPDLMRAIQESRMGFMPDALRPIAAKAIAGDRLNPEEYQALVDNNRMDLIREGRQARQINEVDERFNQGFGIKKGQSAISADLEYITDVIPSPSTVTKEQQRQAALNRITQVFNEVANNPNLDLMSLIGQDAALQDALRQTSFQDIRELAGTGANLTGMEPKLISDQLFATLGTDPVSALGRYLTGKDQKQFARDFASVLNKLEDARLLKTYGAKRTNRALSSYDPALLQSIRGRAQGNWANEIDSILSGQQGQPQAPSSPNAGMKKQINPRTGAVRYVPR